MLELTQVHKAYATRTALAGVSLRLEAGEIFGLLGPNGAGKSTLVAIAVGLLEAERGAASLHGPGSPAGSPSDPAVRRRIGLAPQALAIYGELSGAENLDFFAAIQGLSAAARRERVAWALDFVGLSERRDDRARTYSGGMARRLNLAAALVHDPELLVLDEPTVGVDPQSRERLLQNVEKLRDLGKTVLYTTHYMEEAQRICDRVGILDRGELLAVDRTGALLATHAGLARLVVDGEEGAPAEVIETDAPLAALERLARERGRAPASFRVERPTLEQVFLKLTGRTLRD